MNLVLFNAFAITIGFCFPAIAFEQTELTAETFNSKVVGYSWLHSSIDQTMKFFPDGSVTIEAPKGTFNGRWEFSDGKGFCREGMFGNTKVP